MTFCGFPPGFNPNLVTRKGDRKPAPRCSAPGCLGLAHHAAWTTRHGKGHLCEAHWWWLEQPGVWLWQPLS